MQRVQLFFGIRRTSGQRRSSEAILTQISGLKNLNANGEVVAFTGSEWPTMVELLLEGRSQ